MRSLFNTRVTALAVTWVLFHAVVVDAQGFWYKNLGLSCSAQQTFQYIGCASVSAYGSASNNDIFGYSPANPIASGNDIPSRSYIAYNEGSQLNNTFTPHYCTDACRAHGFKYAALFDGGGCKCGMSLTRGSVTINPSQSEASCSVELCPGDRGEFCGASAYARIFVDPSFPDEGGLLTAAQQVPDYTLLGCFRKPNFDAYESNVLDITAPNAAQCLTLCADYGYPLARMAFISGGSPSYVDNL